MPKRIATEDARDKSASSAWRPLSSVFRLLPYGVVPVTMKLSKVTSIVAAPPHQVSRT